MFHCRSVLNFFANGRRAVHSALLSGALCVTVSLRGGDAVTVAGEVVRLDPFQVVNTATRTERLISEVPIRTELVAHEEMEMRATLYFSQAVELLNGVRVESNCQNCNTAEVQLLGLGGAYNQILFDGTPLLSSLGGVYGIDQIPMVFVDRLEVIKGGGSALYGAGAVAGAINLVPEQPRVNGGFFQLGVNVQNGEPQWTADGRANAVWANGKAGVSLVGQAGLGGAIDFNGDGYSEVTEKDLGVAGVQTWLTPTERTKIRANYQYTQEHRRGGNRLDQPEYLANIAESLQTKYHRGGVTLNHEISAGFDFQLGYAFAYIARDSFYGGLGDVVTDPTDPAYDPSELDPMNPGSAAAAAYDQYGYTKNPLHYWDSQFNWRLNAHALSFGAQYRRELLRDENRNFTGQLLHITADDDYTNMGFFVQDEWSATRTLDVVLGARIDRSSKLDDPIFSPRLAVAMAVTEIVKLRIGMSTGFRAPELFSEDLHVTTLGAEPVRIRNAVGLSEESAVIYMAGVEWRNDATAPTMAFDLTASLSDIKDTFLLSDIVTDGNGDLYRERTNASGSRTEGIEANLVYAPGEQLRVTTGMAWYRSRYDQAEIVFDDTANGGVTVIAARDYLKTPNWSGVFQAVWTPVKALNLFAGLKYTGRMNVLNNTTGTLNRVPDFWVVDTGLTRHFTLPSGKHIDVAFGVKNLLNQRQRDLESGANRDSTYVYGPRFARSYYVTVKYEF